MECEDVFAQRNNYPFVLPVVGRLRSLQSGNPQMGLRNFPEGKKSTLGLARARVVLPADLDEAAAAPPFHFPHSARVTQPSREFCGRTDGRRSAAFACMQAKGDLERAGWVSRFGDFTVHFTLSRTISLLVSDYRQCFEVYIVQVMIWPKYKMM